MRGSILVSCVVAAFACGKGGGDAKSKPAPDTTADAATAKPDPATPDPAKPDPAKPDPATPAAPEIVSEEVSFTADGRTIAGTITRPKNATGARPAVLLLAGSGPTDRNWNSPLLPGTNGSAKLLAEELARSGFVTLRFDKAGSGTNPGPPPGKATLDTFRDEALGALASLRARADVDRAHVFIAGNSEGGIHATRVAAAAEAGSVAGVVYLASASRSMMDTMLTQLEGTNFRDSAKMSEPEIEKHMAPIRKACADFLAGKDVDASKVGEIPEIQQLLGGLFAPQSAGLMRDLFGFDNAVEGAKLRVPAYVANGGKDLQVDPELDARRLEKLFREAGRPVTLHLSPDANHVFKHEPKSVADLRANPMAAVGGYNTDGLVLDPDFTAALLAWLNAQTDMVAVPAGDLKRGCGTRKGHCTEPAGTTAVPAFSIDRTEVTVAAYRACVDAGTCTPPQVGDKCEAAQLNWDKPDRTDHPVNCIDATQAAAYCTFRGKQLPTATQWELAARGTDARVFPWGDDEPTCARAVLHDKKPGCGEDHTAPVGSRPTGASPSGALDMSGNVAELTVDDKNVPYGRGGSYQHRAYEDELTTYRTATALAAAATGFRCAKP